MISNPTVNSKKVVIMSLCPRHARSSLLIIAALACFSSCKESAKNKDGVVCKGASEEIVAMDPPHKWLMTGVVRAPAASLPPAKEGSDAQGFLDTLIPSAHAFALEDEKPVAGAKIHLKPPREIKLSGVFTETDAQGRYCLLASDVWEPDGVWMITATWEGGTLRQRAVFTHDVDLNAASEALVRVWEKGGFEASQPEPEAWLNARTIADTRLGLMEGVELKEGESLDDLIGRMEKALTEDERLMEILGAEPE